MTGPRYQHGHGYGEGLLPFVIACIAVLLVIVIGVGFAAWYGIAWLVDFLMPGAQAAEQAGPIFQAAAGVPWYVMLGLVMFPGVVAVSLTVISMIVVRRVNRAGGYPPLPVATAVKWTLGLGVLFGPLCQWTLQELSGALSGVPVIWKLIVIAPFITGLASMAVYEGLRVYTRTRYPTIYALLSVKHRDHGPSDQNGDLTIYVAQGAQGFPDDDVTRPKE